MIGRLAVTVWMVALGALCALLAPGDWRGLVVLPLFGIWAAWATPSAHGAHADTGRLGLTSPAPSRPAGTLYDPLAPVHKPVRNQPPWHTWSGTGADGLWDANKAELWPDHDDPWYLPDAGAAGGAPAVAAPAPDRAAAKTSPDGPPAAAALYPAGPGAPSLTPGPAVPAPGQPDASQAAPSMAGDGGTGGPGADHPGAPGPEPSTAWLDRVEAEVRGWSLKLQQGRSQP